MPWCLAPKVCFCFLSSPKLLVGDPKYAFWIPACAGMTLLDLLSSLPTGPRLRREAGPVKCVAFPGLKSLKFYDLKFLRAGKEKQ